MWIQSTYRYALFHKLTKAFTVCAQKLLKVHPSAHKNLKRQAEGGLFRQTVYSHDQKAFDFYHRGSDADLGVIRQIVFDEDYNLGRFKQASWVESAYRIALAEQRKPPLIIDAGANIGLGSLYLRNKFPACQLVCVEPALSNFEILQRNIPDSTTTRLIKGAINSSAQFIELMDPNEGEWGFTTHKTNTQTTNKLESVPCFRFEDLVSSQSTPFILKVDIEGGEKEEFHNHDLLSRFAVIIVELHDWLYPGERTSSSLLEFAASADFDFVHAGENIFLFNRKFMPQR